MNVRKKTIDVNWFVTRKRKNSKYGLGKFVDELYSNTIPKESCVIDFDCLNKNGTLKKSVLRSISNNNSINWTLEEEEENDDDDDESEKSNKRRKTNK